MADYALIVLDRRRHRSVHSALRGLLALLVVVGIPLSPGGFAGITWGAGPTGPVAIREARTLTMSELGHERGSEERAESAVVLVVLDGVRWQEVFSGADRGLANVRGNSPLAWANPRALMPNMYRLIETRGVAIGAPGRGAEISATGPQFISLPGYLEIFVGHSDSRCDCNVCARPPGRTIVDDVRESSGPDDAAVITSWPNIARAASADASGFVLSSGRTIMSRGQVLRADRTTSDLLDRGAHASAWPGEGDYRPDAITGRIALRHLATARPRFLFVGLGDADELAHRSDYQGYLAALHASDDFLGDLIETLDEMGARGRHTTVIVTTDHGRAYDFRDHGPTHPESGRVWLVAGGGDARTGGLVASTRRHTLSDVAPTVRALLGITSGDGEPIAEVIGRPGQ